MDNIQALILALIQGVSEFLPISSSAHLILPSEILGWPDQGLAFDVAVHVGSLIAVVSYFHKDLFNMLKQGTASVFNPSMMTANKDARLAWMVVLATLPAVVFGLLMNDFIEQHLRSMQVIAATTIIFGLLLGVAEYKSKNSSATRELTLLVAMIIGFSQALALIPGTSRSGITITIAVLLGLSKVDAARFSFLLSIPIILAAGLFKGIELIELKPVFSTQQLIIGVAVSALSAWCCIALFLKLIEKIGFMPFVWYRLALGGLLVYLSLNQ